MIRSFDMPYGAFELKRCYQRNMAYGTAFGVFLSAMIVGAACLIAALQGDPIIPITGERQIPVITIIDLGPPPPIGYEIEIPEFTKPAGADFEIGVPVPIDDGLIAEEPARLPRRDDLKSIQPPSFLPGNGKGAVVIPPIHIDDSVPPDTFIPVETRPVPVYEEPVVYPRLALEGGFSAELYIKAYVGSDGRVKKAEAIRCTRPGVGFEEAAVAAAYKYIYRPAIQNGDPVGVWIAYRVRFVIE